MNRVVRKVVVLVMVGVAAAGLSIAVAAPASADSAQHVYNTGGDGLWLHPDAPTLDSNLSILMPEGTQFDVSCWQIGDDVNGDSVWDYGTDTATGMVGYAADYYIDTPVTHGTEGPQLSALGIPQCGGDSSETGDATDSGLTPTDALNTYDRYAARQYALDHAQDPQISGAQCTDFVSQALFAGGFPQTNTWNKTDPYGGSFTGTVTTWNVEPFVDYMAANYSVYPEDITSSLATNAVPDAQLGDVIAYDWEGDGELDHLALVVDIASGQYPEVSEMGQFDWTRHPWYRLNNPSSDYPKRGWTYSKMQQTWLQSEDGHANMRAFLLHMPDTPLSPTS